MRKEHNHKVDETVLQLMYIENLAFPVSSNSAETRSVRKDKNLCLIKSKEAILINIKQISGKKRTVPHF